MGSPLSKEQASFNYMAAVTTCSDFGVQENKICHCFHFFPLYFPWSDGTVFLIWASSQLFYYSLSVSSRGSSLSAISMVSSEYLRLLIFLAILIPSWDSSNPSFYMMYSSYKLNKQGNNIQPWRTPFLIWSQSLVPCLVLTCFLTCIQVSQEKVVWYSHLLKNFPHCAVIHTVKGFSIVNKAEVDVFLEFPCLFYDSMDVGNLISGSSAFSKSSLYIWKLSVHILLKPTLKDLCWIHKYYY